MLVKTTLKRIKRKVQQQWVLYKLNKVYSKRSDWNTISAIIKKHEDISIFFTHDNSGGTRAFELVYLKKKNPILLVRRMGYGFMPDSYFKLEFYHLEKQENSVLLDRSELFELFKYPYREIVVNSFVNFKCYKKLIETIIKYKQKYNSCYIMYFVHDYHSVCPSTNLFADGSYCNLECSKRICSLNDNYGNITIDEWRRIWSRFLEKIDEIRCFSNSTGELLKKVYPDIPGEKINVIPHDMSYCTYKPIENIEKLDLKIGICGSVSTDYKGREVVSNLIKNYGHEIPITIIGSPAWRFRIFRRKVKYLGPYKRDELRDLILREKISVVIFPSLCPETFSYLISELIQMDIPILCFNIGAQAEKVSKYHKGIVCENPQELYALIERMKSKER